MTGTITFEGNPYPGGHAVKSFEWFTTMADDGSVWLQLHLESAAYSDSEPVPEDGDSDWTSTTVWENYEQCILSSVHWRNGGIKVADSAAGFDLDKLTDRTLRVDVVDDASNDLDDPEDHAIGIYLLGHDSCANHTIRFTKNSEGLFNVDWQGDIALSYAGEDEYEHHFVAHIEDAKFGGIATDMRRSS